MPTLDEQQLSKFYDAGDTIALERLLERHSRDLHWLLTRCVGDEAIARKLLVELYGVVYLTRHSRRYRLDASRGPVKGQLLALAGALALSCLMGRLDLRHDDDA